MIHQIADDRRIVGTKERDPGFDDVATIDASNTELIHTSCPYLALQLVTPLARLQELLECSLHGRCNGSCSAVFCIARVRG